MSKNVAINGFLRNTFVCWFICLFVYLVIPARFVWAAGEFRADYDVQYAVAPSGTTIVTQNISLTNRLTNLYPKEYSILIDSDKIKNVIASDARGIITPALAVKDGKTEISLVFNEQVVGLGKTLSFTLRYEHGDVAHKVGSIWEVNVPGVEDDPDLGNYDVTLTVPAGFGPAAYISPPPADGVRWRRDQLTQGGISAAYGKEQIFALSLSYFLENAAVSPKIGEIALPPDTPFQEVVISRITPEPMAVVVDPDGNWLAQYELSPGQKIDIQALITVSIRLLPKTGLGQSIQPQDYLKPAPYWEVYDANIVSLAQKYRTPRQIYDYVVRTLSYSYDRVSQNPTRKGAAAALRSPEQSVCMEFTDLFIAIARAAGIPAREAVGFAYTTNSKLRPLSLVNDVLHAWPEYYDSLRNLWIPVDPTWGNTTGGINYFDKLDFNHIVFAYHGGSSETPYPAGFYRNSSREGKDVEVSFGQAIIGTSDTPLSIVFNLPKRVIAGLALTGNVTVKNKSGRKLDDISVTVESVPLTFQKTLAGTNVPPYGEVTVPVSISTGNFLVGQKGKFVATANGQNASYTVDITPLYFTGVPVVIVLIVVGGPALWIVARKRKLWKTIQKS